MKTHPHEDMSTTVHEALLITAKNWKQPKGPTNLDKQTAVYPFYILLLSNKKKKPKDQYNREESQKHMKWKKSN